MMRNKIALEEHFGATDPDIVGQSKEHFTPQTWPEARKQLLDINNTRLRKMDALGIERNIFSLLAPGIQSMYTPATPSTGPGASTTTRPRLIEP